MIVVRDLSATQEIAHPQIKQLVQQRINDLDGVEFESSELGYFLVVEACDSKENIHTQVGFHILRNRFTGTLFDATGFTPSFEFIEEFSACYGILFVLDDTGFGVQIFVPKEEGID